MIPRALLSVQLLIRICCTSVCVVTVWALRAAKKQQSCMSCLLIPTKKQFFKLGIKNKILCIWLNPDISIMAFTMSAVYMNILLHAILWLLLHWCAEGHQGFESLAYRLKVLLNDVFILQCPWNSVVFLYLNLQKIKTPHQCTMCHTSLQMSNMVHHKSDEGVVELFCNRYCVTSYTLQCEIVDKLQGTRQ